MKPESVTLFSAMNRVKLSDLEKIDIDNRAFYRTTKEENIRPYKTLRKKLSMQVHLTYTTLLKRRRLTTILSIESSVTA